MTQKPKKKQKIFIEALEQRIMLDGAGASTFLDLIDERNQEEIKKNYSKDFQADINTQINFQTPCLLCCKKKERFILF